MFCLHVSVHNMHGWEPEEGGPVTRATDGCKPNKSVDFIRILSPWQKHICLTHPVGKRKTSKTFMQKPFKWFSIEYLIQQIVSMYHVLGPPLRTETKKVMLEDRSFF